MFVMPGYEITTDGIRKIENYEEEYYYYSENEKWYSGSGSPEERAKEPAKAWNRKKFVVADV